MVLPIMAFLLPKGYKLSEFLTAFCWRGIFRKSDKCGLDVGKRESSTRVYLSPALNRQPRLEQSSIRSSLPDLWQGDRKH